MSYQNTSKHVLRATGLCLALAGAFALPQANAQSAAAQDQVAVKDKATGKLRAATPEEANVLETARKAKKSAMRVAPEHTRSKYHRSGAAGARLTDEMLTNAVVVRAADGTLVHECQDAAGHANHAPLAVSPAPTPVTE